MSKGRGRPKLPRNYCTTAQDVQNEKTNKELKRRKNISNTMKNYRENERNIQKACEQGIKLDLNHFEKFLDLIFLEEFQTGSESDNKDINNNKG